MKEDIKSLDRNITQCKYDNNKHIYAYVARFNFLTLLNWPLIVKENWQIKNKQLNNVKEL